MKRFPELVFLFTVLSGISLFLAGCGGGTDPADEAMAEGVFLVNNGAEPRSLDPHIVTGMPEHRVIKSLLEGLVGDHPTDSDKVAPGMASSWEPNADASEWTFHLREASWSNGDPVTAGHFLYAFRRILNPDFGAPYVSMLFRVKNARAYNEGEMADFSSVGVKAPDPRTLVVTLDGPTPYFPLMLTHYTWFPVHPDTLEGFDAFSRRDTGWTLPENHVGNGPFILKEWKPNQRIIVEKNPCYWDAENVALNAMHFFPVQDRQTENRMFRSGQLHKTDGIPYNLRQRYREDSNPAFREDPMFATGYLGLNTLHEGLGDKRVRRALSLALDRALIVREVTKNGVAAGVLSRPGFPPMTMPTSCRTIRKKRGSYWPRPAIPEERVSRSSSSSLPIRIPAGPSPKSFRKCGVASWASKSRSSTRNGKCSSPTWTTGTSTSSSSPGSAITSIPPLS